MTEGRSPQCAEDDEQLEETGDSEKDGETRVEEEGDKETDELASSMLPSPSPVCMMTHAQKQRDLPFQMIFVELTPHQTF